MSLKARRFVRYRAVDRSHNMTVPFTVRSRFHCADQDRIIAAAKKAIGPARGGLFRLELYTPGVMPPWCDLGITLHLAGAVGVRQELEAEAL